MSLNYGSYLGPGAYGTYLGPDVNNPATISINENNFSYPSDKTVENLNRTRLNNTVTNPNTLIYPGSNASDPAAAAFTNYALQDPSVHVVDEFTGLLDSNALQDEIEVAFDPLQTIIPDIDYGINPITGIVRSNGRDYKINNKVEFTNCFCELLGDKKQCRNGSICQGIGRNWNQMGPVPGGPIGIGRGFNQPKLPGVPYGFCGPCDGSSAKNPYKCDPYRAYGQQYQQYMQSYYNYYAAKGYAVPPRYCPKPYYGNQGYDPFFLNNKDHFPGPGPYPAPGPYPGPGPYQGPGGCAIPCTLGPKPCEEPCKAECCVKTTCKGGYNLVNKKYKYKVCDDSCSSDSSDSSDSCSSAGSCGRKKKIKIIKKKIPRRSCKY